MNLNTLARNGAFDVAGVTEAVAARLSDAQTLEKVRPMPYQLMTALGQVGEGVPLKVQAALEAISRKGNVRICPLADPN